MNASGLPPLVYDNWYIMWASKELPRSCKLPAGCLNKSCRAEQAIRTLETLESLAANWERLFPRSMPANWQLKCESMLEIS